MRVPAIFFMVLACGAPAIAQPAAAMISGDPLRDAKDWVRGFCGEATYREGWAETRDISGDGLPDVVLRFHISCYDKELPFCGSRGCMTQVWFGRPDGQYQRALAHYALAVEPISFKGVPAFKIHTDGLACGKRGGQTCEFIKIWTGEELLTVWSNENS